MCKEIRIRNVKIKEAKPGFFLTIGETLIEGRREDDQGAPTRVENTWSISEEELLDLRDAIDRIISNKERRQI